MPMKLKSFGCSFVFGSDLGDEHSSPDLVPHILPSRKTWPALFSKHLDYDYECLARPGSGNLQILEKIMNNLDADPHDLYVIGWTWIDRFDHYNSDGHTVTWSDWNTIRPSETDKISKFYYLNLHSEYADKLNNLICVKTAIDFLQQKKIKFVMTYMDELMFDQIWHTTPAVKNLQEYVQPYMTTFEGQTFLNWSRKHKFPESNNWHPLEEAHCAAADYMISVLDKQKIIDPVLQAHV